MRQGGSLLGDEREFKFFTKLDDELRYDFKHPFCLNPCAQEGHDCIELLQKRLICALQKCGEEEELCKDTVYIGAGRLKIGHKGGGMAVQIEPQTFLKFIFPIIESQIAPSDFCKCRGGHSRARRTQSGLPSLLFAPRGRRAGWPPASLKTSWRVVANLEEALAEFRMDATL